MIPFKASIFDWKPEVLSPTLCHGYMNTSKYPDVLSELWKESILRIATERKNLFLVSDTTGVMAEFRFCNRLIESRHGTVVIYESLQPLTLAGHVYLYITVPSLP